MLSFVKLFCLVKESLVKVIVPRWKLLKIIISWLPESVADRCSLANIPKYGKKLSTFAQVILTITTSRKPLSRSALGFETFIGLAHLLGNNGIFSLSIFNRQAFILTKPATAKVLLRCKENVSKSNFEEFMQPWLRDGLITSEKRIWREHRKLLAPTMYPRIVNSYLSTFIRNSDSLVENLSEYEGQPIDIIKFIKYCTLDIVTETTMGVNIGFQKQKDEKYLDSVKILTKGALVRLFTPWYWSNWLFKFFAFGKEYNKALAYTRSVTLKIIEDRKQYLLDNSQTDDGANKIKNQDILDSKYTLDILLNLHFEVESFTLNLVQDHVESFLLGGHDTSALVMSFALYLLSQNPDCLEKVHDELDEVFGIHSDRPFVIADASELKYLEYVIKEAARLYPPVPFIGRKLNKNMEIDGISIPKGSTCAVFIYKIHRDPTVFKNPEEFLPERFCGSNGDSQDPYSFLAFSAGPRGCIGQKFAMLSMKVILSSVLRRFTISSRLPRDKIVLVSHLFSSPLQGLQISLHRR